VKRRKRTSNDTSQFRKLRLFEAGCAVDLTHPLQTLLFALRQRPEGDRREEKASGAERVGADSVDGHSHLIVRDHANQDRCYGCSDQTED
jgi:hypothetical protein